MAKWRQAAKVDANQPAIVDALKALPGVTVDVGHDDILIGYDKKTFWIEIKNPDLVSKVTGEILPSALKQKQKDLLKDWTGHYEVCWDIDQIKEEIGYV